MLKKLKKIKDFFMKFKKKIYKVSSCYKYIEGFETLKQKTFYSY